MLHIVAGHALALAVTACVAATARAQEPYPSRLITIVAPITAGTAIDILARLYADKLAKRFGQQVVVANRGGAAGLIGAQAVAGSAPDGYTVLFANSGHAILGTLNKNLPFDPVADFAGVSVVGEAPAIVVVPPSLGVANLNELVALARSKPGEINYGSAGIGTSTHLAGAYFALKTGIDIVHVPYTVSSGIIADLLGGRIQASFVPMAFVLPLLQDGRLRALAVAAEAPVSEPVAIPTALSQGVDYQYATWYGMLAPRKTPKPVLAVLNQAITEAGRDPELQEKIRVQGIEPRDIGLEAFDAHIAKDMERIAPLLKAIAQNH
ncbi:MAG TPA: tripartite tricarboxylate transporter substrate-binding protein [Xanthobacteraceae bacterium]